MQITIDIPDEAAVVAAEQGLTPESYAAQLVREELRARAERMHKIERFLSEFPIQGLPGLPESGYRRESWYGDDD